MHPSAPRALASMDFLGWVGFVGVALAGIALSAALLRSLPVSVAMIYLALGIALGPAGLELLPLDGPGGLGVLLRIVEVAVLVSLFAGGLKLRVGLAHPSLRAAAVLAGPVMVFSIAATAAAGRLVAGLGPSAAIVLGAILAPTDPVLASEVSVRHAADSDRLRVALSAEAGLNDGAAFPFVVLGLELAKHGGTLGAWTLEWLAVRVLFAVPAGLAIGFMIGHAIGRIAIALRARVGESEGHDALLAIATIAVAYASAEAVHAWGFLAVFAAGVGLRRAEVLLVRTSSPAPPLEPTVEDREPSETPAEALVEREVSHDALSHPAVAAGAILRDANATCMTLERIAEIVTVTIVGALLVPLFDVRGLVVAGLLFFVARPLACALFLRGIELGPRQRRLIGWLGIRGIGSVFYLAWAIDQGLDPADARTVAGIVVTTIAASIVAHGITVTPLVRAYEDRLREAPSDRPIVRV